MSRIITVFACSLLLLLSACTNDKDPDSPGYIPMSKTTKGAILGGAAGGGLASISRSPGATAVGAVAGAALGAIIGSQIEKHDKALELHEHGSGVKLVKHGSNTQLLMPSAIYFPSGSATVPHKYDAMLNGVVTLMKANPDTLIEVTGYTDNQGDVANNRVLAGKRAANVAAFLQHQGIQSDRLRVVSRAQSSPQANNSTYHGREQNRRVEIKLWS